VRLIDQHEFPRDKVCGDGLIPDAHAALRRLGLYDEVMAQARHLRHVRCIGPRGGMVDVPGSLAVLPRRQLDHILFRRRSVPVRCAHAGEIRSTAARRRARGGSAAEGR
jgi:menaquinone-9 beta-reductase